MARTKTPPDTKTRQGRTSRKALGSTIPDLGGRKPRMVTNFRSPRQAEIAGNEAFAAVESLFPKEFLEEAARRLGVIERQSKFRIVPFFWSLVLSLSVHAKRSLAELGRQYNTVADTDLVPSAFYVRFTPELVALLKEAVDRGLRQIGLGVTKLTGFLAGFTDVLIFDATIVRLHKSLQWLYPGTRINHSPAAAKITVVHSVVQNGPVSVDMVPGKTADVKTITIGNWVNNRLLLFDLGYFKFGIFASIMKHKGYFLSRLKGRVAPWILGIVSPERIGVPAGTRLPDILPYFQGQDIDCVVECDFKRRAYNGTRRSDTVRLRVFGHWNAETLEHHLYLTNIMELSLTAALAAELYRARWIIELVFKELKSQYHMEALSTTNPDVAETLIFSAILTLIVSRRVLDLMRFWGKWQGKRYSDLKWSKHFSEIAPRILADLLHRLGEDEGWMLWVVCSSMEGPDRNRAARHLSDIFGSLPA